MGNERLKRAYGYVRVSTKQQAGEDRMGIEAQKQAISEYADRNGYEIVQWFVDEASGVKEDRPKFNEILYTDLPVQDKIEAVIAYKSDRIARDIKLYFYFLFVLERKRVRLLSVSEQFGDDDTGLATVFRALMLFVAEQERKNIAMRTIAGRKVKSEQGGYSGGRVPYGYTVSDHRLVVVPEEAAMVREVFELRKTHTMHDVAVILNEWGYRTRSGKLFCTSHIQSILSNKTIYIGMYKYSDSRCVKGQQEAILGKAGRQYDKLSKRYIMFPNEVPHYDDDDDVAPECDEDTPPDLIEEPEVEPELPVEPVQPERPAFVGGVFMA